VGARDTHCTACSSVRFAGTTRDHATTARAQRLFDVGEEKAIAEHAGVVADSGFPLNLELLRGIAQYMINERQMIQRGHGKYIGPKPTTTNPILLVVCGLIDSSSATPDLRKYIFSIRRDPRLQHAMMLSCKQI